MRFHHHKRYKVNVHHQNNDVSKNVCFFGHIVEFLKLELVKTVGQTLYYRVPYQLPMNKKCTIELTVTHIAQKNDKPPMNNCDFAVGFTESTNIAPETWTEENCFVWSPNSGCYNRREKIENTVLLNPIEILKIKFEVDTLNKIVVTHVNNRTWNAEFDFKNPTFVLRLSGVSDAFAYVQIERFSIQNPNQPSLPSALLGLFRKQNFAKTRKIRPNFCFEFIRLTNCQQI